MFAVELLLRFPTKRMFRFLAKANMIMQTSEDMLVANKTLDHQGYEA